MASVLSSLRKVFFGYDIFISYSRTDAGEYSEALAIALQQKKFKCYLDRWSAKPSPTLTDELRKKLRMSKVLLVLGTDGALESKFVSQEIDYFLNQGGEQLIPVDFGRIREANWYSRIDGLPLTLEKDGRLDMKKEPSERLLKRIEHSCTFQKVSTRLNYFAKGSVFVFISMLVLSFFAIDRLSTLNDKVYRADQELTHSELLLKSRKEIDSFDALNAQNSLSEAIKIEQDLGLEQLRSDLYLSEVANLGLPEIFSTGGKIQDLLALDSLVLCSSLEKSGINTISIRSRDGTVHSLIQGDFNGLCFSTGSNILTTEIKDRELYLIEFDINLKELQRIQLNPIATSNGVRLLQDSGFTFKHVECSIDFNPELNYAIINGEFLFDRTQTYFGYLQAKYYGCVDFSNDREVGIYDTIFSEGLIDPNSTYISNNCSIQGSDNGKLIVRQESGVYLYDFCTGETSIVHSNGSLVEIDRIDFDVHTATINSEGNVGILGGQEAIVLFQLVQDTVFSSLRYELEEERLLDAAFVDSNTFYIAQNYLPLRMFEIGEYDFRTHQTSGRSYRLDEQICYKSEEEIMLGSIDSASDLQLMVKDGMILTSNLPGSLNSMDYKHLHNRISVANLFPPLASCADFSFDLHTGTRRVSCFDLDKNSEALIAGCENGDVLIWFISDKMLGSFDSFFQHYLIPWIGWTRLDSLSGEHNHLANKDTEAILKVHPDDSTLIIAAYLIDNNPNPSYRIDILDLSTSRVLAEDTIKMDGHVHFSSDGRTMAITRTEGESIRVHKLNDEDLIKPSLIIKSPGVFYRRPLLSPDSKWLYSYFGSNIRIWSIENPEISTTYITSYQIDEMTLSIKDESKLLYSSKNGVKVLNTP